MKLNIATFNCCSLRKNINLIRDLTENSYDIIFLQETFVLEDRLDDLTYIDENYESIGVAAEYSEKAISSNAGRAEGGLACIWKKNAPFKVDKIILQDNLIGIRLMLGNHSILLVNVYVRSVSWEISTVDAYLEYLNQLESLMANTQFECIYFIGDFNADPFTGRSWNYLSDFMTRSSLECFDFSILDSSTFTFISYGNSYCKWLDHVVGRNSDAIRVSAAKVLYDRIGSDHVPLTFTLDVEVNDDTIVHSDLNNDASPKYVNWDRLSIDEIHEIEEKALHIMGRYLEKRVVLCSRLGCRNIDHKQEIDSLIDLFVQSIRLASEFVSREKCKKNKFKVIPGWNRNVKHLHSIARREYLNWLELGKLRNSVEYKTMDESRRNFKHALNDCKLNELREISISVEEKYKNKNMKCFWKEVHSTNNKQKRSKIIDGQTDKQGIIRLFTNKFLINENPEQRGGEDELIGRLREKWRTSYKMNLKMSVHSLKKFIQRLNAGMGHDGIHSSFLKRASEKFLENLVCLMNACYSHCYIPIETLKGDVNPTIKDQRGNCTESSNYRPVMQSSCILKIFEMHILDILEEKVVFNNRQFGFKKGTSTTDACLILKEVVHRYMKGKGKVFSAFIDLSKAFDKVDHFILGHTLLDREIPADIVVLLMHYIRNQSARVIWDGASGEYHLINEGVRQGGILSPFLFKLYIDQMISDISAMDVGCKLGFMRINILAYADDIVLIADTRENLEQIYVHFALCVDELKLVMNRNKSKCMIFENSRYGNRIQELELGNDILENVTEYKYLGHIVERNLRDTRDVENRLNQFYVKFNTTYRKFKTVSIETFLYLFNSYCLPDYGLALWNLNEILNAHIFKVFQVAYHNALKKIVGVPVAFSNHDIAEYCNQFLFQHYIVSLQSRYFKRIAKSGNSLVRLCLPFLTLGYNVESLSNILKEKYTVDLESNDYDVIRARICRVQKDEIPTGLRFFI